MKTSSAELKLRARQTLLGKYGTPIGAVLINYGIIMGVMIVMEVALMMSALFSIGRDETWALVFMVIVIIVCYLAMMVLEMMIVPGMIRMHLNMCKDEKAVVTNLFFAFKNRPGKFLGLTLLMGLVTLILVVPTAFVSFATLYAGAYGFNIAFNIIYSILILVLSFCFSLNYGQFYIILVEDPDKSLLEALKESKQLMKGNRGRYFWLMLSFIGWMILMYLTMGIGYLWLMPYMLATHIHFYLDLKPQIEEIPPQWKLDLEQSFDEE